MCGLIGVVARRGVTPDLRAALDAMAHRGPDGEGTFTRGPVALGHRRLSIIDLTEAASQPMTIPGRGTIVFNGEIFDYADHRGAFEARGEPLTTRSDTEVLLRGLALDGERALAGLHGMYAFAWLSEDGRKLVLGRDHAGIKPLYVWRGAEGIAFASEVRSLAVLVRALGGNVHVDASAIVDVLAWGSVQEPGTILAGATMLPVDTLLEIDTADPSRPRRVDVRRLRMRSRTRDTAQALGRTRSAVEHAVSRHLVADHPVALFLSGGIDSSVLAVEMARAAGPKPHAITVRLGSAGAEDEPAIATRTAERLGLPLHMVEIADWRQRMEGVLDRFDQPSVDGLNTYLVSHVARQLGYRVALTGLGADEVFGGYPHLFARARTWSRHVPESRAVDWVSRGLARLPDARARRVGMLLEGADRGEPVSARWRRLLPDHRIRAVFPGLPPARLPVDDPDPLAFERSHYMLNTLLRDTDVMGMACGVEIRAPFLDPEVLETGLEIGTETILDPALPPKWLLRQGWQGVLDPSTLQRKKSGFILDVASWLRTDARERVQATRTHLRGLGFVSPAAFDGYWRTCEAGLASGHPTGWVSVFALVQLDTALRRWGSP